MADPTLTPDGGWSGLAALMTSLGALFKARSGVSRHALNDSINVIVGPLAMRVTSIEAHADDTSRRLDSIEGKIDRLLERR